MQRRHEMPFGAQVQDDGTVRFRLWAPAARSVDLCLGEPPHELLLPLHHEGDGWFSLDCDAAHHGTHYCYRIDSDTRVPDPASRFQPLDVHGPSEVIDARGFDWQDGDWTGRPWEEAVFYELHVGAFTPLGTFGAIEDRLAYLSDLGVTAIELMPVADFPGTRNWGYDGALPFAPDSEYGRPEEFKHLVQSAHAMGLMVFLDVVYNHFGPEGNYLSRYAPPFFTGRHHTPWGAAIDFEGPYRHWVREFFLQNALYWLEEYHLDGLRLDAVHAIYDDTRPDILEELADRVHARFADRRHVHLVLENDNNIAHYLDRGRGFAAQWNDDLHHALHVLVTGETGGYYSDYAASPVACAGRALAEGFAYQGEASAYRQGKPRGEPSAHLPATAFVAFLQNHDQVGNRAFGERLGLLAPADAVRAATAVLLLAPSPPLLFMGQEWNSTQTFPFFCDFGPDLATSVTEGRRREFARFPAFQDPQAPEQIPDPMAERTFELARLDWARLSDAEGAAWFAFHQRLIATRHREIVPRLTALPGNGGRYDTWGDGTIRVSWRLADNSRLTLLANLGSHPKPSREIPSGRLIARVPDRLEEELRQGRLPAWSVGWWVDPS